MPIRRRASPSTPTGVSFNTETAKTGGAEHRSPCFSHAKRTLYHLSYTPEGLVSDADKLNVAKSIAKSQKNDTQFGKINTNFANQTPTLFLPGNGWLHCRRSQHVVGASLQRVVHGQVAVVAHLEQAVIGPEGYLSMGILL